MNHKSLDEQIAEAESLLISLKAEKESRTEEPWKVYVFQDRIGYSDYALAVAFARTITEAREIITKEVVHTLVDRTIDEFTLTFHCLLEENAGLPFPLAYLRVSDKDYLPF